MNSRPGPTARRRHEPAAALPVARVAVDVPLAHLDRPFDYLVPAGVDESVRPGVRVRVRFAGQLVDGFVLERAESSDHTGRLAFLERVVSPEPVLTAEVARLARAVADRYAGTLADVLRLAVPPRHARAESVAAGADGAGRVRPARPDPAGWARYPAGAALLTNLAEGRGPRAVWTALPDEDWPVRVAEAVAATVYSGRSVVVVVPDSRDLARLDAALGTVAAGCEGEAVAHVTLSAALGPAERYRRFLRASRGQAAAVIGTRAAMFAPVERLGLVVIWDDGDDLHAEPRAPYPHAREVLLTRAQLCGAAALVGGYGRTAEAQLLLDSGWAKEVVATRDAVRARAPAVAPAGEDQLARDPAAAAARLPTLAWRAARDALRGNAPVLVQVPRRGYLPAVSCVDCHAPARCPHCGGPLALHSARSSATCRWCARVAAAYTCPHCGGRRLRAAVVGARRTAEELGRAFPGVPVHTSGRDGVLATVPDEPALVVATPGAEPVADGAGYGAVLLLDTWALLTRADLRAGEETLRRWLAAAALARPGRSGGRVVVVADGALPVVQALLRWDPGWYARRELADRVALGFPPATRMASLTGPPDAVADLLRLVELPQGTAVLGPVPVPARDGGAEAERMLLRAPRSAGPALAAALRAAAGVRSARKATGSVRIQVDPRELL